MGSMLEAFAGDCDVQQESACLWPSRMCMQVGTQMPTTSDETMGDMIDPMHLVACIMALA